MARKFVTGREINFINKINHELIQSVSGQVVHYYAISIPETDVHRLYKESVQKVWSPPVHCNARVRYGNTVTKSGPGLDSEYDLEVYFHKEELTERNVKPREGDFIEFGQIYFEITSVTQPQLVFGQVNNKIMIKCVCVKSREGQFQAGGRSSEGVDHSHPIENSVCCHECD